MTARALGLPEAAALAAQLGQVVAIDLRDPVPDDVLARAVWVSPLTLRREPLTAREALICLNAGDEVLFTGDISGQLVVLGCDDLPDDHALLVLAHAATPGRVTRHLIARVGRVWRASPQLQVSA